MKKLLKISSIAVVLAALLNGCGGGGGGSSSENISGVVSGSFYQGATVCYDTDGDGSCSDENSEYTDTSDENGEFTLPKKSYPIIAIIDTNTIKHERIGDSGTSITNTTKTVFAIPAEVIEKAKEQGDGKVIVSAISTKIYQEVKNGKSIDQAMQAVANALGVSKDKLLINFNKSNRVDEQTRIAIKNKAEALLEKIKGKSSLTEVTNQISNYVSSYTLPDRIDVIRN